MTVFIREHVGPDAMGFLARQWNNLYAEDELATPFQSSAWLTAWARHLPHTATPIVLAATSPSGRVLAALALASHTGPGRTRILPLSAPHAECVRPVGPHADDTTVAQALAFHLLLASDGGAEVVMTDMPATSAMGSFLIALCKDTGWDSTATTCAVIPLPVHYARLPPSTQRQHARRRRTWARLAHNRTITYSRTRHTQDLLNAFDTLFQLHQQPWEGHDPLPGSLQASEYDRWQAIVRDLSATNACIASLAVEATVIAAQLLLTRGTHCYSLIPAMNLAHRHLAPGHALLRHLIDDLASEGFRTLDLGRTTGPQEPFKRSYGPLWTSTVSALSTSHGAAASGNRCASSAASL
ncbi:GNAT family N-acetyltransferase [Streptomyces sp. DT193]|uniref:GNAT family N-acetyltransferase n=1 Tax=Streptomyces sp. DT193 TaxID=3393418 RepID=UPI003CEB6512